MEAGGTKFVCMAGAGPDDVRASVKFDTTDPHETLSRVVSFFAGLPELPRSIGIGSFGPVDLDPASPTWGYITSTPKPGWRNTDFARFLQRALDVPVMFDTDVNAAALGELRWGAAHDQAGCLYLTVGTGVGGGAVVEGRAIHGLVHPEMGHVRIPRADGDVFPGACPFHGDCLEGMVSGPALFERCGRPADQLDDDDPAWEFTAHYLAHAIVNYICTLSPERIIIGGGVMRRAHLFPNIRSRVGSLLNGYVRHESILDDIHAYIVPPALGDRAGALGALAMAMEVTALDKSAQAVS